MAYLALSTANLPNPAIDPAQGSEPRDYFETFLYTGNGGGLQVGDVIKKPADTTTISSSLIFDDGDSGYYTRTNASAGTRTTYTISCWLKRGNIGTATVPIFGSNSGSDWDMLYISSADVVAFSQSTEAVSNFRSDAKLKDTSRWYHLVLAVDTTQATSTDRVKLYIDGVLASFSTALYPPQNEPSNINANGTVHYIGKHPTASSYYDGYFAEFHFVDGTAHAATDFGNFDANGIWIPKAVTGITYGTNGFYLDFADNTSTTTLGDDESGNTNDYTPNGSIAATDQVADSPTDNHYTWSASDKSGVTLTEGNLDAHLASAGVYNGVRGSTALPSTGKYYWEADVITIDTDDHVTIGIGTKATSLSSFLGQVATTVIYNFNDSGQTSAVYNGTSNVFTGNSTFAAVATNVVQIAYDATNGYIWFGKNNTWADSSGGTTGNPSTGANPTVSSIASGEYFPIFGGGDNNSNIAVDFGQRGFTYTPPTGYVALSENNITVDDQNLKRPDLVWIKNRDNGDNHYLYDRIRGVTKTLSSDINSAEYDSPNALLNFNTNGFTVGSDGGVNRASQDYVAWCWKANGSGTSIAAGSIDGTNPTIASTVSANTTSGFSIVKFIGDNDGVNTSKTIGHGLSNPPEVVIIKQTELNAWYVYHKSLGATQVINLDRNVAATTNASVWNNTAPDSDVFTVGWNGGANGDTKTHISYCFHSVDGFSKFGSYQGNNLGGNDGPFVYLGFQPALVILKYTGSSNGWFMFDNAREPNNHKDQFIMADMDAFTTEYTQAARGIDFLSNGFKLRTDAAYDPNGSGTYIYMAWAESPFKFSTAR